VEDEPDVREYLKASLEDAGFQVVTASNGLEAYQRVKETAVDFITLDLVMPRQSGVLFYKKLKKNPKWVGIPVVVITAHARDDLGQGDLAELLRGDVPRPLDVLEKPVNREQLVRTVGEALGAEVPEVGGSEETRAEIFARLRNADSDTLKRVQEALDGPRKTS